MTIVKNKDANTIATYNDFLSLKTLDYDKIWKMGHQLISIKIRADLYLTDKNNNTVGIRIIDEDEIMVRIYSKQFFGKTFHINSKVNLNRIKKQLNNDSVLGIFNLRLISFVTINRKEKVRCLWKRTASDKLIKMILSTVDGKRFYKLKMKDVVGAAGKMRNEICYYEQSTYRKSSTCDPTGKFI